jgi:hypothetical protein
MIMDKKKSSFEQRMAMRSQSAEVGGRSPGSDQSEYGPGTGQCEPRVNLVFAAKLLHRLREGSMPSPRALEWSGFIEHWTVITRDDVYFLTGVVWRLPLRRQTLVTPLLAINPTAGWALIVGEWLTIGAPCIDLGGHGIHPESVADSAVQWLQRQLGTDDGRGVPFQGSS